MQKENFLSVTLCMAICLSLLFAACDGREESGNVGDCRDGLSSGQQSSQTDIGFLSLPISIFIQRTMEYSHSSWTQEFVIEDDEIVSSIMLLLEKKEQLDEPYEAVPEDALRLRIQDGEGTSYTMAVWQDEEKTCIKGECGSFTAPEETYRRLWSCGTSGRV